MLFFCCCKILPCYFYYFIILNICIFDILILILSHYGSHQVIVSIWLQIIYIVRNFTILACNAESSYGHFSLVLHVVTLKDNAWIVSWIRVTATAIALSIISGIESSILDDLISTDFARCPIFKIIPWLIWIARRMWKNLDHLKRNKEHGYLWV